MAKCVLQVTGKETNAACGTEQIAVVVEGGIEYGIHDMRLLWGTALPGVLLGVLPH